MSHRINLYEKHVKRPQDFICALFATISLFPAMLIIAVLVRVKLGSPILFKQERTGKGYTFCYDCNNNRGDDECNNCIYYDDGEEVNTNEK